MDILSQSSPIVQLGTNSPPSNEPQFYPFPNDHNPDDDEIAREVFRRWDGRFAYFYNTWYEYRDGWWQDLDVDQVKRVVRDELSSMRSKKIQVGLTRLNSVTGLTRLDCFVSDRRIEETGVERQKYINLQNGLFNLEEHRLEAHRPEVYFTHILPFSFDQRAKCPNFLKFLETSLMTEDGQIDRDMIALVFQALAYSFTARTDLKASFWCVGKPNSGKSTLINILNEMSGSMHTTIDLNQLAANRFLLNGLVGKRIATFTESSVGSMLPDAIYKTMIGQDEIYADVKNKAAIHFKPETKIWWAMNEPPRTSDRSGAVVNRLRLILFPRTIPLDEQIGNLPELLRSEMPGIFNFMMTFYALLQDNGQFVSPAASTAWLNDFQQRNDTEATFLEQCCIRDPNGKTSSRQLYDRYKMWCEENGFMGKKNINQVASDWKRLGLVEKKLDGYPQWHGITVKTATTVGYGNL